MNDKILANELKSWFQHTDFTKPHFLSRNPVAKLLKEELGRLGHWRKVPPTKKAKSPKANPFKTNNAKPELDF